MIRTLMNMLAPGAVKDSEPITLFPKRESFYRQIQRKFAEENECPCCETAGELYSGPSGGMCINVMCFACGSRFNTFGGGEIMEFTHGPQDELWDKDRKPTERPHPDRVARVKLAIEGKGL